MNADAPLIIAGSSLRSRLILGTGKYPSFEVMRQAHERAEVDLVTVAVRRANLSGEGESVLDYIHRERIRVLPNTAGCYTVADAVNTAHLAERFGLSKWIKLEVIGNERTLLPDTLGLLEATKILVGEGFTVLPYTNDDPIMAKRLEDAGAAAVMPLAAPIGSGLGVLNPLNIQLIREAVRVPVIVDAGVGSAADACIGMELGVEGILLNSAVAGAADPPGMAEAMRDAVRAGRRAFLSGRIPKRPYAAASSPLEGVVKA